MFAWQTSGIQAPNKARRSSTWVTSCDFSMNWPRNKGVENFGDTEVAHLRNHPLRQWVALQEARQAVEFCADRAGTNGWDPTVLTGAQASWPIAGSHSGDSYDGVFANRGSRARCCA